MQQTIDETNYRREKQIRFNTENNITPQKLTKEISSALIKEKSYDELRKVEIQQAAEKAAEYLSASEIEKRIKDRRKSMEKAAKDLDFMKAAQLRDEIKTLQEILKTSSK